MATQTVPQSSTRYHGQAEQAAQQILNAFQTGDLPEALAPIFIRRGSDSDVPCAKWSWSNQLLCAIHGTSDARGFRQWLDVKRSVRKGQKAFYILAPCVKKRTVKDEGGEESEKTYVTGFRGVAVFALEQTEGEPIKPADPQLAAWIDQLPLVDVARGWGLDVRAYSGDGARCYGKYYRRGIALGVENLSTWCHELVHAADDRLHGLEGGQRWDQEIIAELGGAILLEVLGFERDADRGGCWQYVSGYAASAELEPVAACQKVLKRTCDAVALILDTARELAAAEVVA